MAVGVKGIMAQRATEQFGAGLRVLLAQHGMRGNDFARRVWGVGPDGKPRNTGKLSQYTMGRARPKPETLAKMAEALDVPVAQLEALFVLKDVPTAAKEPPWVAAVTAKAPPAKPAEPDQFSLVIDHAGMATLRLNMLGVPMQSALRAMSALTAAGILPTGETT